MADYMEDTIGGVEASDEFLLVGNCDIWVSGRTSGSVKLQIKFPGAGKIFQDVPGESYAVDTSKTIFISEHGVMGRLVGVSCNAGVYVRLARFLNK
jgi:hypothetical protein